MRDYSKGKIYKLFFKENIYVGSTTCSLERRFIEHKTRMNYENGPLYNTKIYQIMREKGKHNFEIELLEECKCYNEKQLLIREQYWIDKLKPSMNTINTKLNLKRGSLDYKKYINDRHEKSKSRLTMYWCSKCDKEFKLCRLGSHRKTIFHIDGKESEFKDIIFLA